MPNEHPGHKLIEVLFSKLANEPKIETVMMDTRDLLIWIGRLRTTFNDNFENNWFFMLMDGVPLDPAALRDIRDFLRIDEAWAINEKRAVEGIRSIEGFIETIRKYLLPCIKEKLRISNLKPEYRVHDRDQVAIRQLVAYALPLKIELLAELVQGFRQGLGEPIAPGTNPAITASA